MVRKLLRRLILWALQEQPQLPAVLQAPSGQILNEWLHGPLPAGREE